MNECGSDPIKILFTKTGAGQIWSVGCDLSSPGLVSSSDASLSERKKKIDTDSYYSSCASYLRLVISFILQEHFAKVIVLSHSTDEKSKFFKLSGFVRL